MSIDFYRAIFSATFWMMVFLAFVFFKKKEAAGAIYVAWIMVVGSSWTGGVLLGLIAKTEALMELSLAISLMGKCLIPLLFLAFVFDYLGKKKWLSRKTFLPLGIFPVLALIISFIPSWNHLLWEVKPANNEVFLFTYSRGILFILYLFYSYLILFTGLFFLFTGLKISTTFFSRHTIIYVLALGLPLVFTLLHNIGIGIFRFIDVSPIGISAGVILIFFGIYNVKGFDIIPSAYKTILETIPEAVLVTDSKDRIVMLNDNFKNLFAPNIFKLGGKHVFEILPELARALPQNKQTDYSFEFRYKSEVFLLSIRYLRKSEENIVGTAFIFQNIEE